MKIQKKNTAMTMLASLYGLQPYYVRVLHKDGRHKRTNLYALAYYVTRKTLRRATTARAMELYDTRATAGAHEWSNMLQQVVTDMILGYTDGKGNYHGGYQTDKVASVDKLLATAYSSINRLLYGNRTQGRNVGQEVLTADYSIVTDIVNIFGYAIHSSNINRVKYQQFIDDIRAHINSTKTIAIFDCAIDNDMINANGTFRKAEIVTLCGCKSGTTIDRAVRKIREVAQDVVQLYNMDTSTFFEWIQTA